MDQQFFSYFAFNLPELILLSALVVFLAINLFFYFKYYRKPLLYVVNNDSDNSVSGSYQPKVSVIITSENEAVQLSQHLPAILEQDYPDYEVIVVNNGSTDESDYLLQSLKLRYPNLYQTYLPYSNDKSFGRRKLALTIGIKAAKGDVLLFTEPYSKPVSNRWISVMVRGISEEKQVALGYSYYKRTDDFFNRVARYDNHLFSMQYLAMAIKDAPFTGVYRNIAFKKHLFFDNKGFASYLNLENGEDVFINQIVTPANTSVVLDEDSFVETYIDNFSLWRQIKKSYSLAKSCFKTKVTNLFAFEAFSRYVFYALTLILLAYAGIIQQWGLLGIVITIFLCRLIPQLVILNKSAKYFRSGKFYFSAILLDLVQPIYNFKFKTRYRKLKGK